MGFIEDYASKVVAMGEKAEKVVINDLTKIAANVKSKGGRPEDVVGIIEKNLIRAPPKHKLPLIYLMDSILYNERGVYVSLFARNLISIFQAAYQEAPQFAKGKMINLLNAWMKRKGSSAFDSVLLNQLSARCDPSYRGPHFSQLPMPSAPQQQPMPASQNQRSTASVPVSQQGTFRNGAPPSAFQSGPHPQMQHQRPGQLGPNVPYNAGQSQYGMPPNAGNPQSVPHVGHSIPHSTLNPQLAAKSEQLLSELLSSLPSTPKTTMAALQNTNPGLYSQVLARAQQEMSASPPGPVPGVPERVPGALPGTAANSIPVNGVPAGMNSVPPQMAPPPMHQGFDFTPIGIAPNYSAMLFDALNKKITLTNEYLMYFGSVANQYSMHPLGQHLHAILSQIPKPLVIDFSPNALGDLNRGMEFVAATLNLGSPFGTIRDEKSNLMFATEELKRKYNTNQDEMKQKLSEVYVRDENAVLRCRQWYIAEQRWINGEKQEEETSSTYFQNTNDKTMVNETKNGNESHKEDDERYNVLADDNYPTCALSGDPFESYWDDSQEEWMYKNAFRPEPNGPIYLIKAWEASQNAQPKRNATDANLEESPDSTKKVKM